MVPVVPEAVRMPPVVAQVAHMRPGLVVPQVQELARTPLEVVARLGTPPEAARTPPEVVVRLGTPPEAAPYHLPPTEGGGQLASRLEDTGPHCFRWIGVLRRRGLPLAAG